MCNFMAASVQACWQPASVRVLQVFSGVSVEVYLAQQLRQLSKVKDQALHTYMHRPSASALYTALLQRCRTAAGTGFPSVEAGKATSTSTSRLAAASSG